MFPAITIATVFGPSLHLYFEDHSFKTLGFNHTDKAPNARLTCFSSNQPLWVLAEVIAEENGL